MIDRLTDITAYVSELNEVLDRRRAAGRCVLSDNIV
jgi:hypothetical protein